MIILLVAAMLCGILLMGCAQEPQLGSNPGTTVPKQTTQPTQTQPKPTETQPKPTEIQPRPTEPQPTEPMPTEPPVTYPILMDFNYKVYTISNHGNNSAGVHNIWILDSEDDRAAIANIEEELAPYDWHYFDTHFLIVVQLYYYIDPGISIHTAQVQKLQDGSLHLELEEHVEKGLLVPGVSYYPTYYIIIEAEGICKENAPVTWHFSLVLEDPSPRE